MLTTRLLRRLFYGLGIAALSVYLLSWLVEAGQQLGSVLIIFLFAGMINLALLPLVRAAQRPQIRGHRIPYSVAVLVVALGSFGIITVALILTVPFMVRDLTGITREIGGHRDEIVELAALTISLLAPFGVSITSVEQVVADYASTVQGLLGQAAGEVLSGLTSIATGIVNFVLVLVVTVYLLLNWGPAIDRLRQMMPDRVARYFDFGASTVHSAFGAYMFGVLVEVVLFGIAVAIVLAIAGVDYIVFPAVISGLLLVIPFVGAVIALLLPILIAALDSWTVAVFWVGIPLLIVQVVLENLVRPNVVGHVAGVNPLVLITSVLVGSALMGFWGIIFGIPLGVLISLTVRAIFLRWAKFESARDDSADSGDASPLSGGEASPP